MFNRYYCWVLILVIACIPSVGYSAKGKVELLPKDGGPPVSLSPSIGLGALAGRFASPVGIAVNAIQLCVELQCINMLAGRNAVPPAVPGWADPATPPTPVSTVERFQVYQLFSNKFPTGGRDTKERACADGVEEFNSAYHGIYDPGTPNACKYYSDATGAQLGNLSFYHMPGQCSTGYQYNSSTGQCDLIPGQEPFVQWPSDSIPTYYDDGDGVWKPYPRDPDVGGLINPPSTVSSNDQDENGNPNKITVKPQSDGGVQTTIQTEGVNSGMGTTEVSQHQITTDIFGNVVNYTYQVFENQTINQINTQTGTLQLPDDYAREQTLQQVRDSLRVTPQSIPANLEDTLVAPLEGIQSEIENLSFDYPSNPAPQITVPPYWEYATGTCYPATWDVGQFGEVSLENFCQIYDDHVRGVLDWMIAVWGVIYLYFYWGQTAKEI
jgi:hypothetical protein